VTPRTLPREPWRGSMICGWQVAFGDWAHPMAFCALRKADGAYACQAHWDEMIEDGESLDFAPGNAVGEPHWAMRLLWEPTEGEEPIEASAEEMALYAPLFV
jgi:hypothetical protein